MYFWNIDGLVQELKAGTISEYEKMKYLLATTLLQLFSLMNGPGFIQFMPVTNTEVLIQSLFFGIIVGVTVWGIYHCFIINKQGDNKNFIERFICLGFPVGVRILVFFSIGLLLWIIFGLFLILFLNKTAYAAATDSNLINSIIMNKPGATMAISNAVMRAGLLRVHIIELITYVIVAVCFYVILGRKIAQVSQKS